QSGIGRGMFTEEDMHAVHARMKADLAKEGIAIAGFYHCPHRPEDGCACRKPATGLLLQAAQDLDINLSKSWFIGNTCSDIQAGRMSNMQTALVYSDDTCIPMPHVRAATLSDAADHI